MELVVTVAGVNEAEISLHIARVAVLHPLLPRLISNTLCLCTNENQAANNSALCAQSGQSVFSPCFGPSSISQSCMVMLKTK